MAASSLHWISPWGRGRIFLKMTALHIQTDFIQLENGFCFLSNTFIPTFSLPSTDHIYLLLAGLKCNVVILGAGNCPSMQQDFLTKESQMWVKKLQIYFTRQAENNTCLLYVIHEVVTSDVCIHPERERQCTCLFVTGSIRSVLYNQLWRDVRTPEMRKPFYCFTVAFVGRLRKPLSHTNRTLEGPNLFCLGLSLGFCVMDKSTFLHTRTPCKSKHGVQVWVCYQFTDARTVFLSSVVQNMDKQAERGWKIGPEHRGGRLGQLSSDKTGMYHR